MDGELDDAAPGTFSPRIARRQSKSAYLYLTITVLLLGFAARAVYMRQSHPYVDEYFTILAAEMVQRYGLPWLPSGLFYSHGFLYTYLVALLGGLVKATGSPAGIAQAVMVYRVPNLLVGAAAMAGLASITRRWFGMRAALVALALMAIYPHGVVWGARVRMYTLVFLAVPVLAYAFYRAALQPDDNRRVVAALSLLAIAALVHNWALILAPLLVVGVLLVSWGHKALTIRSWRRWLLGLAVLAAVGVLSSRLESLWLAGPEAASQDTGWQGLSAATLGRLNLLASLSHDASFVRDFGWDNPFNLPILGLAILGGFGILFLFRSRRRQADGGRYAWPMLYLYVLFLGTVGEFLFLLSPDLKQPQYASPILLLAFIILGGWVEIGLGQLSRRVPGANNVLFTCIVILGILMGFGQLAAWQIPKIFYEGLPAIAYERAFQFVRANSAPGEPVLSPIPAAAFLYLGDAGYFVAQDATHTFVHVNPQGIIGDRWTGAPWLRGAGELKQTLLNSPRTWLVIDALSFDSQFHADWKLIMRYNTAKVWDQDGVMVFRGEGLAYDLPTEPDIPRHDQLGDVVELAGYSQKIAPEGLHLTLFWQVVAHLPYDYTTFVHIRDQAGKTVAQVDAQPLAGDYPTSRWRVGEMVVDSILVPLPAKLPAGTYRLLVGLYRWDTLERLPVMNDASGENAVELERMTLQR
jgi:hypothetical protein